MSKATSAISRRGIEQILATGDQSGHAMEYEADRVFAAAHAKPATSPMRYPFIERSSLPET